MFSFHGTFLVPVSRDMPCAGACPDTLTISPIRTQPAGLLHSHAWLQQQAPDTFDYIDHPSWHTLLSATCWFHSILHERAKLGSSGLSVPYQFDESDLMYTIDCLRAIAIEPEIKKDLNLIWSALQHLVSEITHGAWVMNEWDQRIVSVLAQTIFEPSLLESGLNLAKEANLPVGLTTEKYFSLLQQMPVNTSLSCYGIACGAAIPLNSQRFNRLKCDLDVLCLKNEQDGRELDKVCDDQPGDILFRVDSLLREIPSQVLLPDDDLDGGFASLPHPAMLTTASTSFTSVPPPSTSSRRSLAGFNHLTVNSTLPITAPSSSSATPRSSQARVASPTGTRAARRSILGSDLLTSAMKRASMAAPDVPPMAPMMRAFLHHEAVQLNTVTQSVGQMLTALKEAFVVR